MTTIVYRDGAMASDTGVWHGDASCRWARKIERGPDGTLYGGCGSAAGVETYLQWVRDGANPATMPTPQPYKDEGSTYNIIIAPLSGGVHILTHEGVEKYPSAPYFATGSGKEVAFGALFMGATVEQALAAAMEHGSGAFGDCDVIRRAE